MSSKLKGLILRQWAHATVKINHSCKKKNKKNMGKTLNVFNIIIIDMGQVFVFSDNEFSLFIITILKYDDCCP